MERLSGPWAGIYVAAYTTQLRGVFYGYAKLCEAQPSDVWSAKAVAKVASRGFADENLALEAAERRAQRVIAAMGSEKGFVSSFMALFTPSKKQAP